MDFGSSFVWEKYVVFGMIGMSVIVGAMGMCVIVGMMGMCVIVVVMEKRSDQSRD